MKYLMLAIVITACFSWAGASSALRLDELSVRVDGQREYSLSDKSAGFYYGMTGVDDWPDGNAGWNVEAKRVFSDYQIFVDGQPLKKVVAKTDVYPYKIVRYYENAVETFYLVDEKKVVVVDVQAQGAEKIGISLSGSIISRPEQTGATAVCRPKLHNGKVVRVGAKDGSSVTVSDSVIEADSDAGGFILVFGANDDSMNLLNEAASDCGKWLSERKARMQEMLDENSLRTNCPDLDKSMAWLMLTADELVTKQHGGWGIYAGLPWFTDFWGRDMFIAMPGTVLCSGQFAVAKDILLSFAKYQDLDEKSTTYGRVPNRLNKEGVLYNTTDGTPRFVMEVLDYLKYTGDISFVKSIYKNVRIATDASLKMYVDEKGYLMHADADTWMDAKRQGKYPCSPRGNRAIDIQSLWYAQLLAATELANCLGKTADAQRWNAAAHMLKDNFEKDFVVNGELIDHLNADGTADCQLRPNTMYAYELIDSDILKKSDIRKLWSRLVYPWGVSSLDQYDDQFHPYHEQWHRYHKDDAYHNGTVWLWLNGMAMQRLIEYGQCDKAYRLFENMNRQALSEGAVGSLSECADAWCRPGKTWARRSGTFLQSWSNSEHLRVWSQYFLGVRPDLLSGKIIVAPRIPMALNDVETVVNIGGGRLEYIFRRYDGKQYLELKLENCKSISLYCDLPGYRAVEIEIKDGESVNFEWNTISLEMHSGVHIELFSPDEGKRDKESADNAFFDGLDFASPCYREDLKSMLRYFNPPLDYFSIE